jgi:hypothetical protein
MSYRVRAVSQCHKFTTHMKSVLLLRWLLRLPECLGWLLLPSSHPPILPSSSHIYGESVLWVSHSYEIRSTEMTTMISKQYLFWLGVLPDLYKCVTNIQEDKQCGSSREFETVNYDLWPVIYLSSLLETSKFWRTYQPWTFLLGVNDVCFEKIYDFKCRIIIYCKYSR